MKEYWKLAKAHMNAVPLPMEPDDIMDAYIAGFEKAKGMACKITEKYHDSIVIHEKMLDLGEEEV